MRSRTGGGGDAWTTEPPTLEPVDLVQIEEVGPLRRAALVVALDGWVNAGSAGTLAAETVASGGSTVAVFDTDALYDYRMQRPTVEFHSGVLRSVEWPELTVTAVAGSTRDVLVLTGAEPNWNWREFSASVVMLCEKLQVAEYVGIGGVPWAAPHTRPTTIMTTSTSSERISAGADRPHGLLRVPGAAVNVIEDAVGRRGLPTVGFWARVPNYVGSDYPAAAMALVEKVSGHLGMAFVLDVLAREASEHRAQLDAAMEQRADVRAMVEQLEQVHDAASVVSGEDLAAEIERFLRDQGR